MALGTVVGAAPKVFAYVALGGSLDDLSRPRRWSRSALLVVLGARRRAVRPAPDRPAAAHDRLTRVLLPGRPALLARRGVPVHGAARGRHRRAGRGGRARCSAGRTASAGSCSACWWRTAAGAGSSRGRCSPPRSRRSGPVGSTAGLEYLARRRRVASPQPPRRVPAQPPERPHAGPHPAGAGAGGGAHGGDRPTAPRSRPWCSRWPRSPTGSTATSRARASRSRRSARSWTRSPTSC